jgi:hypothetical protein
VSAWTINDARLTFRTDDHSYWLGTRRLPSVTQVLSDVGVADFSAPHFSDDVKERGSIIHQMIALDVEEQLDDASVTDELRPYLEGWRLFLSESHAAIEFWEQPICDPELGYAGRLDGIVVLPQAGATRRTVIDVKRALYPSAGPQVAAYTRCARHLYETPVLFNRAALILPGDGSYMLRPLTDANDEHTFLAALRLFHWRRQHGVAA